MVEQTNSALTVSQALSWVNRTLAVRSVVVAGEVSELVIKPGYKAVYFKLADESGQAVMPCMIWRTQFDKLGITLKDGMAVQVFGAFGVYPARGQLQFSVKAIRLVGEGQLREQVAQLAAKLHQAGLMDPAKKQALPSRPERIGLVTSPHGKAVHDVQKTLNRRNPSIELVFAGVPVEGKTAANEMIEALKLLVDVGVDVIILGRGGGSYEDYMPFNDERLARAIAACPIPIVTGIGHEPDTSIADMVADRQASTPTAAAELVAPELARELADLGRIETRLDERVELLLSRSQERCDQAHDRLMAAIDGAINARKAMCSQRIQRFIWVSRLLLQSHRSWLAQIDPRLHRAIPDSLARDKRMYEALIGSFKAAIWYPVNRRKRDLDGTKIRLEHVADGMLSSQQALIGSASAALEALSPLKVLSRGYAFAATADEVGNRIIVDSVNRVSEGDDLILTLVDGQLKTKVTARITKE